MQIHLVILFDKKGKDSLQFIIQFYWKTLFRLTSQCEKCGQELYPGLQETSSGSCKCKNNNQKVCFILFEKELLTENSSLG